MTTAGQAATAEIVTVAAGAPGWWSRSLGFGAVGLALLSALATFLVLADLTPIPETNEVVVALLLANAITVTFLVAVSALEVWRIVQARRRGRAASRLHVRIVGLFSIIAAAPAVLVAVVASVTLDRGLDKLFSRQTQSLIQNSLIVADAYVREHAQFLRADCITTAIEVARAKTLFDQNREQFRQFLTAQSNIRGLPAVMMIDGDLNVVEQADVKVDQTFVKPSREVLAASNETDPQIALFLDNNYVAAIIKLQSYANTYLYVARMLDPQVVAQLRATQAGVTQYAELEAQRLGIQIAFALMYTVIALIVLLSAVWIALNFANYLVAPIRRLIDAAKIVSTGNLFVQVPIQAGEGDLAQRLVGHSQAEALGRPLAEVAPELTELLAGARGGTQRLLQGQVTINRNGRERNLSVRVTEEQSGEAEHGYVITLDDITDLVAAQRTSAWADVARRIAHEIKNPLTPIQLSAERLRRKYGSVVKDEEGVFRQCTDTIVRQVDDIKRMVDEFSRFARMPRPVMEADDVADAVRQVVFLLRVGHPDIEIEAEFAEDPMPARFDRRLISQALTNIIKNATEAIAAMPPAELGRGHIRVSAAREGGDIVIDVIDNGIGLPKENRSRLLEPYVTTREKGTGLGLAIVGRILEDRAGLGSCSPRRRARCKAS